MCNGGWKAIQHMRIDSFFFAFDCTYNLSRLAFCLLRCSLPFFRSYLCSSLSFLPCPCRQVQATGCLAPRGIFISCYVISPLDLNRQVVRSENCLVRIPMLELEVPPSRNRAELNTIEGFVLSFAENLTCAALYQTQIQQNDTAEKLHELVGKLKALAAGKTPFLFELEDPSGNSYVESLDLAAEKAEEGTEKREDANQENHDCARLLNKKGNTGTEQKEAEETQQHVRPTDTRLTVKYFERTKEQLHAMGYFEAQNSTEEDSQSKSA